MAEDSQVVSFRLNAAQAEVLKGIADVRQISLHECARSMVIESLSGEWLMGQIATQTALLSHVTKQLTEIDVKLEDLGDRVNIVQRDSSDTLQHLFEFRTHFKKAVVATLAGVYPNQTREQIDAWCDENLRSELQ